MAGQGSRNQLIHQAGRSYMPIPSWVLDTIVSAFVATANVPYHVTYVQSRAFITYLKSLPPNCLSSLQQIWLYDQNKSAKIVYDTVLNVIGGLQITEIDSLAPFSLYSAKLWRFEHVFSWSVFIRYVASVIFLLLAYTAYWPRKSIICFALSWW